MDYRTDWALRVEGELAEGVFDWDVAYLIGDGFDANGVPQRGAQAQARAWLNPLRSLRGPDAGILASVAGGFFVCGGYAYNWDWHGRLRIRNPAGTRLFDTSFKADAPLHAQRRLRVGPVRPTTRHAGRLLLTPRRSARTSTTRPTPAATLVADHRRAVDGRIFHECDSNRWART
jgi:hypothetical protein